eukprot:5909398-Pyramimonas_sp.AAC.2
MHSTPQRPFATRPVVIRGLDNKVGQYVGWKKYAYYTTYYTDVLFGFIKAPGTPEYHTLYPMAAGPRGPSRTGT